MIDAVPDLDVLSSGALRAAVCPSTHIYRTLLCVQSNQIKYFNADGACTCADLDVQL